MKWRKMGLVFCANGESDFMHLGGRAPILYCGNGEKLKIFFGSYDIEGRGRIFSMDFSLQFDTFSYDINIVPNIDLGETGLYDDNGIIPSSILLVENSIYLYTCGFSIKNKLIFDSAAGIAVSSNGGCSFSKYPGPVLDRSIDDACFATSPCVIYDEGIYKMWYVSCNKWKRMPDGTLKHYYNIRYKESDNAIYWPAKSRVAIDFANEHEYAIARPSVIKDGPSDYKMWYCFREKSNTATYRIGYAESKDGISWVRKDDDAGIDVSPCGWDSEMICYPYVFDYAGNRYMLYNGNGYGRTGFGLAILE